MYFGHLPFIPDPIHPVPLLRLGQRGPVSESFKATIALKGDKTDQVQNPVF
jgi:hypothetical protein